MNVPAISTSPQQEGEHLAEFATRVREALDRVPPDSDALHALGLEAGTTGRPEESLELFSRAVELNPENPLYFVSMGRLLAAETMFNQAALAYLRAQELAPTDPSVLTELASVLRQLHKDTEASAVLARANELASEAATAETPSL